MAKIEHIQQAIVIVLFIPIYPNPTPAVNTNPLNKNDIKLNNLGRNEDIKVNIEIGNTSEYKQNNSKLVNGLIRNKLFTIKFIIFRAHWNKPTKSFENLAENDFVALNL